MENPPLREFLKLLIKGTAAFQFYSSSYRCYSASAVTEDGLKMPRNSRWELKRSWPAIRQGSSPVAAELRPWPEEFKSGISKLRGFDCQAKMIAIVSILDIESRDLQSWIYLNPIFVLLSSVNWVMELNIGPGTRTTCRLTAFSSCKGSTPWCTLLWEDH